ncbi:MAG TPA: alpha/beta hydrolase [Frankiaceae bacterium]|nr:alpha/beta hydrolase [Frankiaceae bacterium]
MPETRYAEANGLSIAYETFGRPTDPPVLLVMGLGTQMIAWPDELCERIADRGYFVVRFDNRDVGLSTHLSELPAPALRDLITNRRRPPYRIEDMAEDAVGLLDELGITDVHLVGASMGGFIAQVIAANHPSRIRSLTLVMTSTGSRRVGHPKPKLFLRLLRRRVVTDRLGSVEAAVETFRIIGSQGYAFDEEHLRDLAGRSWDRAYDPHGYLRQLAAVLGQRNRTRQLQRLRVPTTVLHGLADPLVNVSGGLALARAIPGAGFIGFAGMGHDLPRPLWPRFAEEICRTAEQADESPRSVRQPR